MYTFFKLGENKTFKKYDAGIQSQRNTQRKS